MSHDIDGFRIEELIARDGRASLSLIGELDLANADRLTTRLTALAKAGFEVRIDLSRLTFIDSSGLRAIIGVLADARQHGWSVTVAREVPAQVRRVFDLSGLTAHVWPKAS